MAILNLMHNQSQIMSTDKSNFTRIFKHCSRDFIMIQYHVFALLWYALTLKPPIKTT